MVDNLVSNAAVVLQDIEIFCATCFGNLLGHGLPEITTVSLLLLRIRSGRDPVTWGGQGSESVDLIPQGPQRRAKGIEGRVTQNSARVFFRSSRTRSSLRSSSGISVSFAPWNLGITSYYIRFSPTVSGIMLFSTLTACDPLRCIRTAYELSYPSV